MHSQSGAMNLGSLIHVAPIASGGMGRVELAAKEEGGFRRLYAVKRLHAHYATDPDMRAMFMDEARIAGLMHHNNVVAVVDVGEDSAGPYLVMDYVDGLAVNQLLACIGRQSIQMPLQVALSIAHEAARGLQAAHELCSHDGEALHVIHRDVSPHNILVGYDGTVRITDFGVAKASGRQALTTSGVLKGKVAYMSPEQLRYEELTPRSDLFSLGVVLFEMLSGRRLYKTREDRTTIRRILDDPPPDIAELRPESPPELVALLFELLAKDPEQRPVSAAAAADEIQTILSSLAAEEGAVTVRSFVEPVTADRRRSQREDHDRSISQATELRRQEVEERQEGEGRQEGEEVDALTSVDANQGRMHPAKWAVPSALVLLMLGMWLGTLRDSGESRPGGSEVNVSSAARVEPDEAMVNTEEGAELEVESEVRVEVPIEAPVDHVVQEEGLAVIAVPPEPVSTGMRRRRRGMRSDPMSASPGGAVEQESTSMAEWEEWEK